jgi:PTS system mannose-specific IIA component
MVGVVVVAHLGIGREMVAATQQIIPEAENFVSVSVEKNETPAAIRDKIDNAIEQVNSPDGVLILTDMFGGTPSNVCLSFLSRPRTEVISGFNLPMLIKLASFKKDSSFEDVITFIQQYGQRNIVIASHVLTGRVHNE